MWGVILSNWPTRQHYELRLTMQANILNHARLKQEKDMLPAARFFTLMLKSFCFPMKTNSVER